MKKFNLGSVFILLYIILSCTIISCTKEPQSEDVVNINDQFELRLAQELTPEGGLPSLHVSSIKPQECKNAYISHQLILSAQKIQLFLNDILTEGDCELGNEYVSEDILISMDNPDLAIEINLKNVIKNSGVLHTYDHEFDLELYEFDGLKISKTHLNRIQPGMIWGSYASSNENITQQIDGYLKELDQNQLKRTGDYGHFYVAQDYSIVIYNEENQGKTNFLIPNYTNFESFKSKILEFEDKEAGLIFHATNYDGSFLIIE